MPSSRRCASSTATCRRSSPLYDYADITGDAQALSWARDGAQTAAALLPEYDTGAWSLYEGPREAKLGYHDLMTLQLRQLALRTGNVLFRIYSDRFAQYRVTPPVIAAAVGPTAASIPPCRTARVRT